MTEGGNGIKPYLKHPNDPPIKKKERESVRKKKQWKEKKANKKKTLRE